MPAGGRFGPQVLGSAFPHAHQQQSHFPHHLAQQHHGGPASSSLPPPSQVNASHMAFSPASTNASLNSFQSPMNGVNGIAGSFAGGGAGFAGAGAGAGLAHAGFHGAQVQQSHHREAMRRSGGAGKGGNKNRIRDVWANNLAQEMQSLRELVDKYPYISMDTEFPGVVIRPMGGFQGAPDYHYQTLRSNVDLLNCIQLGITLFNEDGEMPPAHPEHGPYQNSNVPCPSTWQFNFKFSLETDMYSAESIDFLQTHGLNMDYHSSMGISPADFGAALVSSGLVMDENVRWISFHAGYDFAYIIKLLFPNPLPPTESQYRELLKIFFPSIYDIKYMVKTVQRTNAINNTGSPPSQTAMQHLSNLGTKNALQDLAEELGVRRQGAAHNAGSDSLLTGKTFWELKKAIFGGLIDDERFLGHVWGLVGHNQAVQRSLAASQEARGAAAAAAAASNERDSSATPATANGGANSGNNNNNSGNNGPSTPKTVASGGSHTPGPNSGLMTPGGGGGVFGRFTMPGR